MIIYLPIYLSIYLSYLFLDFVASKKGGSVYLIVWRSRPFFRGAEQKENRNPSSPAPTTPSFTTIFFFFCSFCVFLLGIIISSVVRPRILSSVFRSLRCVAFGTVVPFFFFSALLLSQSHNLIHCPRRPTFNSSVSSFANVLSLRLVACLVSSVCPRCARHHP